MTLPVLTHDAFSFPGIRYGFFTRVGGVSDGIFESLNCGIGSGDDVNKVHENRSRIAASVGVPYSHLLTCYQIHSSKVVPVTAPWPVTDRPKADAMVTKQKGMALAIATADCGPILFYDPEAKVIGAAHAGWRGAVDGVLENTVDAMEQLGGRAENIHAVIGACIQQASYEVGPEFPAPFLQQDEGNRAFFKEALRAQHFMFDLPGYIRHRLLQAGLENVHNLGFDTFADEATFFSYRRRTLRGDTGHGTLLSVITLAD